MLQSFRWRWLFACIASLSTATLSGAAEFDKFLPKETDLIVSLNVRQMVDSPLGKEFASDLLKSLLANNKQTQLALKTLGLDPLSDFNRISMGVGLKDFNSPTAVIVIEGRFDAKKFGDLLSGLAKDEPAQFAVDKVAGKTVYKIATPHQPVPLYAVPIDSSLLVLATSKECIAAAFEAANGVRKSVIRKELADLLAKADSASSLYIVADTKGRLDSIPRLSAELKKMLEPIYSMTANLKVGKDVQLDLAVGASGADEAKRIRDVVDSGIGLAKIQIKVALGQQTELQPLIDFISGITVIQREKTVTVAGKLNGESLERALKK